MLLKRASREAITHQMILWRNNMPFENTLSKNQSLILQELIEVEKDAKSE